MKSLDLSEVNVEVISTFPRPFVRIKSKNHDEIYIAAALEPIAQKLVNGERLDSVEKITAGAALSWFINSVKS